MKIQWRSLVHRGTSRLQVVEYRVRVRETGTNNWLATDTGIIPPQPSVSTVVQHTVDDIWDCETDYDFEISGRGDGITYDDHNFGIDVIVTSAPACPLADGHQADHTAYYRNGTFAPTAQTAIKKHIHDAAKAWNTAISEHDLLICNDLLPTTNPDRIPCNGQNSDGYTTTVKSVETTETTWTGGCRTSFACVTNIDLHGLLPGVLGKHRGDMDLVLESPGFSCDEDDDGCDRAIKYLWLDNPSKHFMFVNGTDDLRGYYAYPLYVLVHEFGHLFGLPDFYKYDEWENSDAVMKTSSRSTISNDDLNQLYAIYARHLRH